MMNPGSNMNPMMIAQRMMQMHPNSCNNPNQMQLLQILMSGDSKKGEEFANNYIQSMGLTKEQAMQQAQSFFSNPGFMR